MAGTTREGGSVQVQGSAIGNGDVDGVIEIRRQAGRIKDKKHPTINRDIAGARGGYAAAAVADIPLCDVHLPAGISGEPHFIGAGDGSIGIDLTCRKDQITTRTSSERNGLIDGNVVACPKGDISGKIAASGDRCIDIDRIGRFDRQVRIVPRNPQRCVERDISSLVPSAPRKPCCHANVSVIGQCIRQRLHTDPGRITTWSKDRRAVSRSFVSLIVIVCRNLNIVRIQQPKTARPRRRARIHLDPVGIQPAA